MEDNKFEEEKILNNYKCSLFRSDGLKKYSSDYLWLEFKEDGTFKEKHKDCSIGRSLLMSPFNFTFTWQTTAVTEIVEEKENYIKFKTENSEYEFYIKQDGK